MPHDHHAPTADIVLLAPPTPRRRTTPRDVLDWTLKLTTLASAAPRMLVWVIARLLADRASPDALLIVSDALYEGADEAAFDGHQPDAAGLRSIAALIDDEVAMRQRGNFW